jgi:hypothetical protein
MDSDITDRLHTTCINTSEALHSAMLRARAEFSLQHWACWVQSGLIVDIKGPVVNRVMVSDQEENGQNNETKTG